MIEECRREHRVSPKGIRRFGFLVICLLVLVGHTACAKESLLTEGSARSTGPCNTSWDDTITLLAQLLLPPTHPAADGPALCVDLAGLAQRS